MTLILAIVLLLVGIVIFFNKRRDSSGDLLLWMVLGMSLGYSNDSILIWSIYSFFAILIVIKEKTNVNLLTYLFPYHVFLLWIVISAFLSRGDSVYFRIMMFLKYLFPVLIYTATVKSFKTQKQIMDFYKRLISYLPFIVAMSVLCFVYKSLLFSYVYFTMTIFLIPIILNSEENNIKKIILIMLCLLIPPIIDIKRTPLLACALGLSTFLFYKYRLKAIVPAVLVVVFLFLIVFFIPTIKEKFFFDSSISPSELIHAGIALESINSNGRTEFWEFAYNNFFIGHELTGSGTGFVKEFIRSPQNPNEAFSLLHNDLLHILCENGIIGIILFFNFVIFVFRKMAKRAKKTKRVILKNMSYCCCGFIIITLTHMLFENCINSLTYSMFFLNYALANKYYYLERYAEKSSISCNKPL